MSSQKSIAYVVQSLAMKTKTTQDISIRKGFNKSDDKLN